MTLVDSLHPRKRQRPDCRNDAVNMRHILPHLSIRVACLGLFCSLTQLVYPVVADTVSWNGAVFGTTYHIEAHSSIQPLDSDDLRKAVADRLEQIDELMSNWKQDSEVSRFNRLVKPDVWFPVSSETAFVVELAKQVSEQTGGAFDVTVGPIVQLWNFGAGRRDEFRVPNDEEIAQALKQIGMAYVDVELDPPRMRKRKAELEIDLSGIAKGYAVDVVSETLLQHGADRYLVEIGGEVRTGGASEDGSSWRVGIESPVRGERSLDSIVLLRGESMATSGDYRNYYERDGIIYTHTVSPHSGRPIQSNLASVTVIAESCCRADALATALMAMGKEAKQWSNDHQVKAVFFHRVDGEILQSMSSAFDSSQIHRIATASSSLNNEVGSVFGITVLVFGFSMLAMSIGVLIANRRLRGTCGGMSAVTDRHDNIVCSLCTRPSDDCVNDETR